MANQQLVDYIKSQLAAGVTKADLQKAITTAGWSMDDSTAAFMVVEGKAPAVPATPATPAAPAAPVASASPAAAAAKPVQPVQPVQQPIQPVQPVQPAAPTRPAAPIGSGVQMPSMQQPAAANLGGPMRASTMQMNVQATTPRRHTALWVTILIIVLLFAGGAAAYLYVPAVQEIVNYYTSGGKVPTQTTDTSGYPALTTTPPASTTPAATGTTTPAGTTSAPMIPASTTPAPAPAGAGMVATSSASATLPH